MRSSTVKQAPSRAKRIQSVTRFKTVPEESIEFNPDSFEVGESNVSRLPERVLPRRNSQPTLPRTEKRLQISGSRRNLIKKSEDESLEFGLLKAINEKLCNENKELKKELELYRKGLSVNISSRKSSRNYGTNSNSSSTSKDLRNIAVEKLNNRTKCSSRLISDSGQGMMCSSKESSYNHQNMGEFESIHEMFNSYKRSIVPTFEQFKKQLNKYFVEIENTCVELNLIFKQVASVALQEEQRQKRTSKKTTENKARIEGISRVNSVLGSIREICALQKKSTFSSGCVKDAASKELHPHLSRKSSKPKIQKAIIGSCGENGNKQQKFELMSPDELIERFQKYLLKLMKSPKMMKSLKGNFVFTRFKNKLTEY